MFQIGMEGLLGHWNPSWNSMPWKHFSSPAERFQVGPPRCQTQWEGKNEFVAAVTGPKISLFVTGL